MSRVQFFALTTALTLAGCDGGDTNRDDDAVETDDSSEDTIACPEDEHKRVLWGDLHVHTNYSFDAYTFNYLSGPDEALAFARGAEVGYPCDLDPSVPCTTRTIAQPLDFVALTEHAEYLGVATACGADGSVENPMFCELFETVVVGAIEYIVTGNGATPEIINEVGDPVDSWQQVQSASDAAYEPCEFTTLHAYEYSPQVQGGMMHRNVFFLGEDIPGNVISSFDADDEWDLWSSLDADCPPGPEGPDCEYITIPHNANLSDGRMFQSPPLVGSGTESERVATQEQIEQRARADVLMEVFNHKGASECHGGYAGPLSSDEACEFEQFKPVCQGTADDPLWCKPECVEVATDATRGVPDDCTTPLDQPRDALVEGLRLADQYEGVNPYAFGFVGATDTHNGDPGSVTERAFPGHGGILDSEPEQLMGRWECPDRRPGCPPGEQEWTAQAMSFNPGGLTAVWARENTREGVFDALARREAYATSGARIETRLYAGWELPADLCDQLASGVEGLDPEALGAVPMGARLEDPPVGGAPTLVVNAVADPITGHPLQRIEIIKGWVDATGEGHVEVVAIAGDADAPSPAPDCTVPLRDEPERLCGRYTDPDFDPDERAFYYARVLENPSCRWNTWLCVDEEVDCDELSPVDGTFSGDLEGYEGCCDITREGPVFRGTDRFDTIEERALTSPVFY